MILRAFAVALPVVCSASTTEEIESTITDEITTSSTTTQSDYNGTAFVWDESGYPSEKDSFFDIYHYDVNQLCYDEFFSGDKDVWAKCCMARSSSNPNCSNYNSEDVCYDVASSGLEGVNAGKFGHYQSWNWEDCCTQHCETGTTCDASLYCRSYLPGWEQFWPDWIWVMLATLSFLSAFACLIAIFCCCGCCCGLAATGKREATIPMNHAINPQVVYVGNGHFRHEGHPVTAGVAPTSHTFIPNDAYVVHPDQHIVYQHIDPAVYLLSPSPPAPVNFQKDVVLVDISDETAADTNIVLISPQSM